MNDNRELNMDEMSAVSGGKHERGLEYQPRKLPAGCEAYRIKRGDTLHDIAAARGTTSAKLMSLNKNLVDGNNIVAGFWLIVPKI